MRRNMSMDQFVPRVGSLDGKRRNNEAFRTTPPATYLPLLPYRKMPSKAAHPTDPHDRCARTNRTSFLLEWALKATERRGAKRGPQGSRFRRLGWSCHWTLGLARPVVTNNVGDGELGI